MNANLQYANLWGANLQGANIIGANLQGASFTGKTILPNNSFWTPGTDTTRFTDVTHPDFWLPEYSDDPSSIYQNWVRQGWLSRE